MGEKKKLAYHKSDVDPATSNPVVTHTFTAQRGRPLSIARSNMDAQSTISSVLRESNGLVGLRALVAGAFHVGLVEERGEEDQVAEVHE